MINNRIKNALETLKYHYSTIVNEAHQTVYNLKMKLNSANADCYVDIRKPNNQLLIRTSTDVLVPVSKRQVIAEFIARVNSFCTLGSFSLDMENGRFEYRCSYLYDESGGNAEEIFKDNLHCNLSVIDDFLPGILSIIYGDKVPKSEFLRLSGQNDPSLN